MINQIFDTLKWYDIHCYKEARIHNTLQRRHNGRDSVSNHQTYDCLLNRLFRRKSKKTSKLRVTGLCVGNSPGTGEFPAQMASNAENVSIWWRHHESEWDNSVSRIWLTRVTSHGGDMDRSSVLLPQRQRSRCGCQSGNIRRKWVNHKTIALTTFSL